MQEISKCLVNRNRPWYRFAVHLGDLHIRRLPGMRVQVVKPAAARLPAAVCPLSALHLHQHEDCSPWIVSPDEGIEEVYDLVLVQALPAATRGLGRHWHPSGAPLLVRWRTIILLFDSQCGFKVARHVERTTISLLAVSQLQANIFQSRGSGRRSAMPSDACSLRLTAAIPQAARPAAAPREAAPQRARPTATPASSSALGAAI